MTNDQDKLTGSGDRRDHDPNVVVYDLRASISYNPNDQYAQFCVQIDGEKPIFTGSLGGAGYALRAAVESGLILAMISKRD